MILGSGRRDGRKCLMRPEAQQVLNRDVLINSFKSPGNLKIRAKLEAGLSREQILTHISRVKVEKPPRREESSLQPLLRILPGRWAPSLRGVAPGMRRLWAASERCPQESVRRETHGLTASLTRAWRHSAVCVTERTESSLNSKAAPLLTAACSLQDA